MAQGSNKGWVVWLALAVAVAIGAAAGVLYAMRSPEIKDRVAVAAPPRSDLHRFATGTLATLETPRDLPATPAYAFKDRQGRDARFADFRGKVVVVNLWAMWCTPCRTEMPTLAALARRYEGGDLVVLPINVDDSEAKLADARSFIDVHEPLPLYSDLRFQLPFEFPGAGKMPQTVILDRRGRVRAWFAGGTDWNSAEAHALLDALLAEPA